MPFIRPNGSSWPSWRSSMAPYTWKKVGTAMDLLNPLNNAALNPNGAGVTGIWQNVPPSNSASQGFSAVVGAWSGGAFDAAKAKLWVTGGGHSDYAGNEVLSIDLMAESPAWTMERPPTGAIGNTGTLEDAQEATQVYFDGRPRSAHTYNNLEWVGSDLYMVPAALFSNPSAENVGQHKVFKLTGGDWSTLMTFPIGTVGATFYGALCYDPSRRQFNFSLSSNSQLQKFGIDGSGYTDSTQYTGVDSQSRLIYLAGLDIIVILCAVFTNRFAIHDFDRTGGGVCPTPPVTGAPPSYASQEHHAAGVWVPSLGAIAIWAGGTGFDLLFPPLSGNPATATWRWSRLEASPSNLVTPDTITANGMYGRFFYSPTLACLGMVTATANQMNIFSLA